MPVPVVCIYCGERGEIPSAFVGRSLRCRKCAREFRAVPETPPGEIPDEIGLAPLSAAEKQDREARHHALQTGASVAAVKSKNEARSLALAWWTKQQRDLPPGAWDHPACEACHETLRPVAGYLCVPKKLEHATGPVFACDVCFVSRKYEPWDPRTLERRREEDKVRKEELARLEAERRRLEQLRPRPVGQAIDSGASDRCVSCRGVIFGGQCMKCGLRYVSCARCRRPALCTAQAEVCTACGYLGPVTGRP